jgi:hypothetical protein
LAAKAYEFGTSSRQHPDRGQVYYFVSISTLGSILDDSEVELPELMPATTPVVAFPSTPAKSPLETVVQSEATPAVAAAIAMPTASAPTPELVTPSVSTVPTEPVDLPQPPAPATPVAIDSVDLPQSSDLSTHVATASSTDLPASIDPVHATVPASVELVASAPDPDPDPTTSATAPVVTILQSELAKRLDVHSSTVYKRRSEPNFTDWTRNRDPDGIGWGFSMASKEYYRVDT